MEVVKQEIIGYPNISHCSIWMIGLMYLSLLQEWHAINLIVTVLWLNKISIDWKLDKQQ